MRKELDIEIYRSLFIVKINDVNSIKVLYISCTYLSLITRIGYSITYKLFTLVIECAVWFP